MTFEKKNSIELINVKIKIDICCKRFELTNCENLFEISDHFFVDFFKFRNEIFEKKNNCKILKLQF